MNTDQKTSESTTYIDLKSAPLRDILRTALQGIKAINLDGDKPAVSILWHPVDFSHVTNEYTRLNGTYYIITFRSWKRAVALLLRGAFTTLKG